MEFCQPKHTNLPSIQCSFFNIVYKQRKPFNHSNDFNDIFELITFRCTKNLQQNKSLLQEKVEKVRMFRSGYQRFTDAKF